ncbi:MAG: radical SAM protein [Candidatus Edwardsbacteria bacterium]
MNEYPRFLTPTLLPYDPLELVSTTEKIVSKDSQRKYTNFYCTGVYGGISTGYTVGCCLRCIFCWVDFSREFPEDYGEFYSPEEVFKRLTENAQTNKLSKLRISGGEPTLCKNHLLKLLKLIEETDYLFVLETNGILLGANLGYAEALGQYSHFHLRLSLKAGTPESFQKRTGAKGEFFELPFQAIKNLMKNNIDFHLAVMSDPRLMPQEERKVLLQKLKQLGYDDYLEEEICDPYETTITRLKKAAEHYEL